MKKKGFTLIELLAVIIILGILMLIAIPSVTNYINNSRKEAYIDSAKELLRGASKLAYSGEYDFSDEKTTYYVPATCVNTENKVSSPFGEFVDDKTYVIINHNGEGYDYYWMSKDEAGFAVKDPTAYDDLDVSAIYQNVEDEDMPLRTVDRRRKLVVYNNDCKTSHDVAVGASGRPLPVNNCTFDGNMTKGAQYVNGQYTYRYLQYNSGGGSSWYDINGHDGWGVTLTDKNSTAPVTTKLCTTINDKPIVSMNSMFYGSKASSIDTSSFDTTHVYNMVYMFANMDGITSLDLSTFVMDNVSEWSVMFNNSRTLNSLNIDNWNISNSGNSVGSVFYNTDNLKYLSAQNWILPEKFEEKFFRNWHADRLVEIDVTDWNLENTTSVYGLFAGGGDLKKIDGLETWKTSNITNMGQLFYMSNHIESFDVSKFDTSNVTNFGLMFYGDFHIYNLDLSNWNTSSLKYMEAMFYNCSRIVELNLDNWDFRSVSSSYGFLQGTGGLNKLSCKNWKIPQNFTNLLQSLNAGYALHYIDVTGWDLSITENISGLFRNGTGIYEVIGMNTWDTSNITNATYLFQGCNNSEFKSLDLGNWNTSNFTSFYGMFSNCSGLKTLNLDGWDFSNLTGTNYGGMFEGTNVLTNLSAKNWKIPKNFTYVFFSTMGNTYLKEIDVTGWDLSKAENITGLFYNGKYLQKIIGLETWNTSNIIDMGQLFEAVSSINTTITISNWNVSNVTSMRRMFYNAYNFTINNLNINASNIDSMFYGAKKISGTLNILKNPSNYGSAFAGTNSSYSETITVNYKPEVTYIDNIIGTNGSYGKVIKGNVI